MKGQSRVFWKEDVLVVPTCVGDIPIGKRTPKAELDNLTIKEIQRGIDRHAFNVRELEYIAHGLCVKTLFYLNNKFVTY